VGLLRAGSSVMRVSVIDFLHVGSSFSVRNFGRCGSNMSTFNFVSLGSALSMRSISKCGCSVSVMDYVNFGSSLSIRRFSRLGGDSTSVFDMMALGSSLSIRSFARLGSSLSVSGDSRIAGDLHLEQTKKLFFNGATNDDYILGKSGGGMEFYSGSNALRLALGTTSYLHGTWTAAGGQFATSDARLKSNIVPLYKSLSKLQQARRAAEAAKTTPTDEEIAAEMDVALKSDDHIVKEVDSQFNTTMLSTKTIKSMAMGDQYASDVADATALFNELRPVSYVMKEKGLVEAKNLRFGFIAQEIEKVLPSLVHTDEDNGKKALNYQDIIAVVVMTLQQEMSVLEGVKSTLKAHDERITSVDERVALLEKELMALREELAAKKLVEEKSVINSDIQMAEPIDNFAAQQATAQQRRSKEPQIKVGRKQEQEIAAGIDSPVIMA